MAKVIWITFLVAASVCAANAGRISSGDVATIEEYPGVVQVESRGFIGWSQTCAGVILTPRNILSAADCFQGLLAIPLYSRIRAGATEREYGGAIFFVDRITNHPSYGSQGYDGNINVVRLETRMVYGPTIQPVTIPPQGFILPENMPVKLVGWGLTSSDGQSADVIRDVETHTINESLCSQLYSSLSRPEVITYNMICASGVIANVVVGACNGDWGGPLFFNQIVMGVTSFGDSCQDLRMPTVSTRVSSYTNWIVQNAI